MTQSIVWTACAVALLGCGPPSWLTTQATRVEPSSDGGHYWVTGTLGFVAEGKGTSLRRLDAPWPSDDPGYALEEGGRVVKISGRTYLFTHGGGILRKGGLGWEELEIRVPPESDFWDAAQVDDVFLVPDGRVLIRSMQRVLFATANDIERGTFQIAQLPRYYDWFGTFDGKLVGTSYDGNNRRAVFVYTRGDIADAASWEVVARLPANTADAYVVAPLAHGGYGVVTSHGINLATPDGVETRFLTLDDLVPVKGRPDPPKPASVSRSPLVVATDDPSAAPSADGQAERPEPAPVVAADPIDALSAALARRVRSADGERTDGVSIQGAQLLASGRLAMWPYQDSGTIPGVAVLGREGARYFACDILSVRHVAGVIEAKEGLWVVTTEASVLELHGDGTCTEPQVPLAPVDHD